MDLIADALLLAGAVTAALYCWVLSKRVKGLNNLDSGLGSAIAALSTQVNDMQAALKATQAVTGSSITEMEELAERAERAAGQLKLMLATVQEEKDTADHQPSPVRKFPQKKRQKRKVQSKPEPVLDEFDDGVADIEDYQQDVAPTRAEQLQKSIAERISERDEASSREELVQALQSILAAQK